MEEQIEMESTLITDELKTEQGQVLSIYSDELVKKYGSRTVVNHISVSLSQGEIVGLLGPNGAGKTTTFYMFVGLVKPDEGNVFLNGENITKLPMYKRAQLGIGYLPQEASIFRKLSVEDNIAGVLEMTKLSKTAQKEKLESLLDEFRLQHVRKSNGDVLSGGERRRTEIARALAVDPKFILLDEPFAGIDPIAVEDIQSIVAKLKYKNIGILITDHNVQETLSITDRAYLMFEGKLLKAGTAEELAADEQVRKVYLGRNFELRRKNYNVHRIAHTDAEKESDALQEVIAKIKQWIQKIEAQNFNHKELEEGDRVEIINMQGYYQSYLMRIHKFHQDLNDSELNSILKEMPEQVNVLENSSYDRLFKLLTQTSKLLYDKY